MLLQYALDWPAVSRNAAYIRMHENFFSQTNRQSTMPSTVYDAGCTWPVYQNAKNMSRTNKQSHHAFLVCK